VRLAYAAALALSLFALGVWCGRVLGDREPAADFGPPFGREIPTAEEAREALVALALAGDHPGLPPAESLRQAALPFGSGAAQFDVARVQVDLQRREFRSEQMGLNRDIGEGIRWTIAGRFARAPDGRWIVVDLVEWHAEMRAAE
jgi:hypothetical protein